MEIGGKPPSESVPAVRAQLRAMMDQLKDNPKRTPGRPKLEIDAVRVEQLATAGLTIPEIGAQFRCDPQTIRKFFRTGG